MSKKENSLKLVAIGDGAVGKTCLLVVYATGNFPTDYVPTIFENYKAKVKVNNIEREILLWDTAGQEELLNIRVLSYPNTHIYLMCFAVVDKPSLQNLKDKWIPEITETIKKKPTFILVGLKTDLRDTNEPEQCISKEEGEAMAQQLGAKAYVECSSLKNSGVKEVFDTAIIEAIKHDDEDTEKSCCIIA